MSRRTLVRDFISGLPKNRPVLVHPERISEWPFIREALAWPSFSNRIRAIVKSSQDVLSPVVPKYSEVCENMGFRFLEEGYLIENPGESNGVDASTLKKFWTMSCRFRRYKRGISLRNFVLGGLFVGLQIPEIFANKFYEFPRYSEQDDHLVYEGPTLREFVSSRQYWNPVRDVIRVVKQRLIEG